VADDEIVASAKRHNGDWITSGVIHKENPHISQATISRRLSKLHRQKHILPVTIMAEYTEFYKVYKVRYNMLICPDCGKTYKCCALDCEVCGAELITMEGNNEQNN